MVKTRLASSIGEEMALDVYRRLLRHTCNVVTQVEAHRYVFYSSYIPSDDLFDEALFHKMLQNGNDLGRRMLNAFEQVIAQGSDQTLIIGSDCPDLSPEILNNAFDQLATHDAVIGPAADGGYYLLGLRRAHQRLFLNKKWSTSSVLKQTLLELKAAGLKTASLPVLSDIDTIEDLRSLRPDWLPVTIRNDKKE